MDILPDAAPVDIATGEEVGDAGSWGGLVSPSVSLNELEEAPILGRDLLRGGFHLAGRRRGRQQAGGNPAGEDGRETSHFSWPGMMTPSPRWRPFGLTTSTFLNSRSEVKVVPVSRPVGESNTKLVSLRSWVWFAVVGLVGVAAGLAALMSFKPNGLGGVLPLGIGAAAALGLAPRSQGMCMQPDHSRDITGDNNRFASQSAVQQGRVWLGQRKA